MHMFSRKRKMASESGKGTGNGDVPVRLHYFELTFLSSAALGAEFLFARSPYRATGPTANFNDSSD